jgi:hypothetical protein
MSNIITPQFTEDEVRKWAKGGTHEHFDCSIEPEFILANASQLGRPIPDALLQQWLAAGNDPVKQALAAAAFQDHASSFAQASLQNYLDAIGLCRRLRRCTTARCRGSSAPKRTV